MCWSIDGFEIYIRTDGVHSYYDGYEIVVRIDSNLERMDTKSSFVLRGNDEYEVVEVNKGFRTDGPSVCFTSMLLVSLLRASYR